MSTTRRVRGRRAARALLPVVLAAPLGAVALGGADAATALRVTVLSSDPAMVTGGDARVRVELPPGLAGKARLLLNGSDVTGALRAGPGGTLEGVVAGMRLGVNTLTAAPTGNGRGAPAPTSLEVTNHPITGPVFSGPHQQPFVCKTQRVGLGQPKVDNTDGEGMRVVDATGAVVGWSRLCSADRQVAYRYRSTAGTWRALPAGPLPADVATTTLLDGRTVPYVVRQERGTINRFIYSIAMLVPGADAAGAEPDRSLWNGRATYSFDGGVAIGHSQGELSDGNSLHTSLGSGYAVLSSTGTRTSVHYNLQLGGETALMVKERFIEAHGVPLYTIGVGGSGGGIQQYVYGQNHPGLIDAGVPQYSYPDMVTQTIHVGDCELLEHFMDVTDGANPRWRSMANRQLLQGMNTSLTPNISSGDLAKWTAFRQVQQALGYAVPDKPAGSTVPLGECRQGWHGLLPLAMNPHFGQAGAGSELMDPPGVMGTVRWTHWEDLRNIYGLDAGGWAREAWDNVGVQYGLEALRAGGISPADFLGLNAGVGSWKKGKDMVQEGCPFLGAPACLAAPSRATWDPWSSRNMRLAGADGIAPRATGDRDAMRAAYTSGLVFDGDIDIPLIDWRHYREADLDMHNSHQSFASRQRMLDHDGDASNMVIWFTDGRPGRLSDQTMDAFAVIDTWMANRRANPGASASATKPALAVDRCFTATGTEIARGDGVWGGVLDSAAAGACTQVFPTYTTSRIEAGGPIRGGVFACTRQSVDAALAKGLYGSWVPTPAERARLDAVFPSGVCDYAAPDAGRP